MGAKIAICDGYNQNMKLFRVRAPSYQDSVLVLLILSLIQV
jgi:hypothetical protein